MFISPLSVEALFNRAPNACGFKSSRVAQIAAPVLTSASVGLRFSSNYSVILATNASPTIQIPFALSGDFAPGSGSGTKYIPQVRVRIAARLVNTGSATLSAMTIKGAARFISPVVSPVTGIQSDGIATDVASAAADFVCQDTVQGNAFPASAIKVDTDISKLRIYEYDPLAGLTAAQRALLTPETVMQLTISTSIAVALNQELNIFGIWVEERKHVGIFNKLRRIMG